MGVSSDIKRKDSIMLGLYRPALGELWFRQALLADAQTMAYNRQWGGVIPFPKERWSDWYARWIDGDEGKRFYRYLLADEAKRFVGETAYHYDDSRGLFLCDIIVHAKYRGRGYGAEGLRLLCEAAKANGIAALYDDIAAQNPSVQLFLSNGFTIDFQTDDIVMVKRTL